METLFLQTKMALTIPPPIFFHYTHFTTRPPQPPKLFLSLFFAPALSPSFKLLNLPGNLLRKEERN